MSAPPTDGAAVSVEHVAQTWQLYCDAWASTSSTERQQLLERLFTPNFVMHGRHASQRGYDAMQQAIAAFQSKVPGATFETKGVRANQGYGLVEWAALSGEGKALMSGSDVIEFAADGRVQKIVAFVA